MKKLFLLAKYYAYKEKSTSIGVEHFQKALQNVRLKDKKAKGLIYSFLELDETEVISIPEDYTKRVTNVGKISFQDKISQLKKHLEDNGFTLNESISSMEIKGSLEIQETESNQSKLKEPTKLEQFSKIKVLKEELNKKVFSQELAIESICDKLSEAVYLSNEKSPKAILFFLGPPATGKSYLPEILAENLDEYRLRMFDMSNFKDSGQGFSLFGLSKGYKDAGEGQLTQAVKEHAKTIIVFDEVEKAHPSILQSFLYVLSQGKARDEFTQEIIDFTETIFIFTSNLGSELYSNKTFLEKLDVDNQSAQTMLLDVISRETALVGGHEVKALSPEFLSRVSQGDLVLFKKLPFASYLKIAQEVFIKNLNSFSNALELKFNDKNVDDLVTLLLLSFLPDIDTRRVKSKISLKVFDPITDAIRDEDITHITEVDIALSDTVKTFLNTFKKKNEDETNQFVSECFRKSYTYQVNLSIKTKKNTLTVEVVDIIKTRVERSKDYQGEGGISIQVPEISFDSIAGHSKAKERLLEVKELLVNPKKLEEHKVDVPKGMLLYGVPGTGKTMLAKAFANEADLPFIATTGSEILNIEFMKKIFKRAREYAPSIIFIDEIDAIGSRNGSSIDIIINQFLTELNGFGDKEDNVFVIGATNLKEKIDSAILRSGRIDQHIEIGVLDKEARAYFIDKIIEKNPNSNFDKEKIITYTAGMSGADLEKVNRESSLYMIKHNIDVLSQENLIEQINIIKHGERIVASSLDELIEGTAYHEAGHAVLSKILSPETVIEQITVVPRDDALGFVAYNNENNISNLTKKAIKNKICILLGGRIAQMEKFGESAFDSGASSDLGQATNLANYAISQLGMGESIGYVSLAKLDESESHSLRNEINNEIKTWLEEARVETDCLVKKYWDKIDSVAQVLIKKEFIEEKELNEIIK